MDVEGSGYLGLLVLIAVGNAPSSQGGLTIARHSIEQFGDLIVAIRRDIGYAKTKLTRDDVLRVILIDYDQMKAVR